MAMDFRNILKIPYMYLLLQKIVCPDIYRKKFVAEHIKPFDGCKILDIGCGPADILRFIEEYGIDYTGFDMSDEYINSAKKKFSDKNVHLYCANVTYDVINDLNLQNNFDIVLGLNILHHLNDGEAITFFEICHLLLKQNGRLVTCDGARKENDHFLSKWMLNHDRGKYVRTGQEYKNIANSIFDDVELSFNTLNTLKVSGVVMTCTKR